MTFVYLDIGVYENYLININTIIRIINHKTNSTQTFSKTKIETV